MRIVKIWLTEDAVWIRRDDGAEASEKFSDYPRLRYATNEQRSHFLADDFGINWPELDEDLSFEAFFETKHITDLHRIFIDHPELNASAIARRLGMSQSLFAQYVSGAKKPSSKRLEEITSTIVTVGKELQEIGRNYLNLARTKDNDQSPT